MPVSYSRCAILLACAAIPLSLLGGQAIAQSEPSPFIGEWELDLGRMPANYGPPPKRVVYTFRAIDAEQWRTTVDITAPDDSVRHAALQYRRDGRMVRGEGDIGEADQAAFNAPAPNILVMSLAKQKSAAGVRVYAISADGQEMTEAAANIDRDGVPFVRNFHFRRIR